MLAKLPGDNEPCACGSGQLATWKTDARYGTPLMATCPVCHEEEMSRFPPEVVTGFVTTETVEEEPVEEEKAEAE